MADLGSKGRGTNYPLSFRRVLNISVLPPMTGNAISGTVTDAEGNGLVRTVRAYVRSTGQLISETVSDANGDFQMNGATAQEHDVVLLDNDSGSVENDQIARTITA